MSIFKAFNGDDYVAAWRYEKLLVEKKKKDSELSTKNSEISALKSENSDMKNLAESGEKDFSDVKLICEDGKTFRLADFSLP